MFSGVLDRLNALSYKAVPDVFYVDDAGQVGVIRSPKGNDNPTVRTGAMIALVPSDADLDRLAVAGGETKDQLHLTLSFLGKAANIPQIVQDGLLTAVGTLVQGKPVVRANGFSVNVFNPTNPDVETCVVLGCSGDDLASVHDEVIMLLGNTASNSGWTPPENHNPWIPHITLAYTNDVFKAPQLVGRTGPIVFDKIRVAYAGKDHDFPLGVEVKAPLSRAKNPKCKYCDKRGTHRIPLQEGRAIYACDNHKKMATRAAAMENKGKLPKRQKCKYCGNQATKRIIHSEGMAYIPVCDTHLGKGKEDAAHCVPDGTRDPSNVDAVRDIKKMGVENRKKPSVLDRLRALCAPMEYKRIVRTAAGAAHFGLPIGSVIGGGKKPTHSPGRRRGEPISGHPHLTRHDQEFIGFHRVHGANGGKYDVGKDRSGRYIVTRAGQWDVLHRGDTRQQALERLSKRVSRDVARATAIAKPKQPKTTSGEKPLESMSVRELREYALNNGMSTIVKLGQRQALINAIRRFQEQQARRASRKTIECLLTITYKTRHVRTPAGAEKYGEPIGSPIVAHEVEKVISKFPGMHPATGGDRIAFKKKTGKTIPPGWTDLHIADDLDTAKLLARGRDSKGRGQSIYSAEHSEGQAAVKFTRIKELSKHTDKLDHALSQDAMDNDHAAALLLIRRLGMRPGSERDTGAEKHAHGATNLRARHVRVEGSTVHFDFTGKKGVHIQLKVEDKYIAEVIKARLRTRSGDERLFQTDESKVRTYMRSTGVPEGFLLKDLRTLHANYVALREITKRRGQPNSKREFQSWRREIAVLVSSELGNTPVLALSSYINPSVFTPWLKDESWA